MPKRRAVRPKQSGNFFLNLIRLTIAVLIGVYVLPVAYNSVTRPIFIAPFFEKPLKVDYYENYKPTAAYLNNNYFMGRLSLEAPNTKKPLMEKLYTSSSMAKLENKLRGLMTGYKQISPSIFVWDYDTGKYVNINADKAFPVASIIKIPVLIELFRTIDSNEDVTLSNMLTLENHNRASGSGSLQSKKTDSMYTMDYLAQIMMQESDNSATNMLLEKIGGKVALNRATRSWGLQSTYIENWLPDLEGENISTAKEISTMLYNIDNSSFLNQGSTDKIIEYMSNVHNDRLIPQGLGKNSIVIHKTGDIGTMLGDAAIVVSENGKKYIVVILAKRPHNAPAGKDFIVKASKIIYDSISSGDV